MAIWASSTALSEEYYLGYVLCRLRAGNLDLSSASARRPLVSEAPRRDEADEDRRNRFMTARRGRRIASCCVATRFLAPIGSSGAVFAAIDIAVRPRVQSHHGLGGKFNAGRGNSARSEKANSYPSRHRTGVAGVAAVAAQTVINRY